MVVLHEIFEGASSSTSTHGHRYDVFLSFRGLDTRNSFTNHLYNALMHANITTFLDDEEIETGEDLKPELGSAIKSSRASVIVLSRNYAASTWCLDELVLILEQRRTSKHIVIPIFYHVEPTHVRKQQSSFGDAMDKHRQKIEAETDENKKCQCAQNMDGWNKALTEVADLKGKDANGRLEVELIDEIVNGIFRKLQIPSRFPLPQLIGMDHSIKFVTSWLKDASSHTTDVLAILGLGGMGKTSLAKYIYALHFHEFDTSSYIENITGRCDEKSNGILDVQKQLYDDILKRSSVQVHDVSTYTSMIRKAVAHKKVFLVLDDIGSLDQLDALLGSKGFHPGTKIIITTKNACLTKSCALFKRNIKPKYVEHKLDGLSTIESQKLLCYHAFMCNDPKVGYEEVSEKIVKYCEGHPMALKVLGRSLHNRDVTYWEGYIDELKNENSQPVTKALRMSFDSLPLKNDKELFKHIACFFVGMDRDVTKTILKACDRWNDEFKIIELMMHQLVQGMGKFLIHEESPDKPGERSRLCCHEESFKVLKQKKGIENVLGLTLDMRMLEKEKLHGSLELKADALSKMDRIMLLQLNYVQITGSYKNFPEELRWLFMHGFPLKFIPSELPLENFVVLDMSYSNIESFGIFYSYPQRFHKRLKQLIGSSSKEKSLLGSLKILNLSFCEQLHSLGGFDHLPVLKKLILRGCIGLLDVCESIEQCLELVFVDLSYCSKLQKIPRIIGMLKKVQTLLLEGCNLESAVPSTVLEAIPSYSKFFTIYLPTSLVNLSLQNNNLSTESFPIDFSCLSMLEELYLDENPLVSMPNCVRNLPRLEVLSVTNCNMMTSVEHPPHTLRILSLYSSQPTLRKVVFDPEMSPLQLLLLWVMLTPSSFEIEGMVKIQPMAGVEEKVLRSLGWTRPDFINERRVGTLTVLEEKEESEIQMYYEFGIFSTIYEGEDMPNWITDRSMGPSISFTISSSANNFTGLNFCYVLTSPSPDVEDELVFLPKIIISNITKNRTWIYHHYRESLFFRRNCLMFLSHWIFGMNEMECGDHVTIMLKESQYVNGDVVTKECGVSFVYDDGEEGEDVLGYYKSWNHIIGGDLTAFQLTTGEYILSKYQILMPSFIKYDYLYREGVHFKDEPMHFRAISQRKSGNLEDGP